VTFAVSAGALTTTAPLASVALGTGAPGTTITGAFGVVTVTDLRGANPSGWIETVSSSAFTDGPGVANIPASAVTYTPGPSTSDSDGVLTPGAAGTLAAPRTAYTLAGGTGSSTTTWDPTLAVAVPTTATATTYTGTVTHLVA
jgi:hypothetical protein